MRPCLVKPLPLARLDWGRFVDVLGKAHETIARFALFTALQKREFLQKREIGAQAPSEREAYKKLLALSESCPKHLSTKLLCALHKELGGKEGGVLRKRQNWIGPKKGGKKEAYFLPPVYQKVPENMKNLQKYSAKKEKDFLVQLAIYFAQLLIIHPFMDGNGRLARALIPIFLYQKKVMPHRYFYLSAYFRKDRLKYFEKLYLISEADDWEGWIRFFLEGVVQEGEAVIRACRRCRSSSFSS